MIETIALVIGYAIMTLGGAAAIGAAFMWVQDKAARLAKIEKAIIEYFFYRKDFEKWKAEHRSQETPRGAGDP